MATTVKTTKVVALSKSFLEAFTGREFDTAAFKCVWDHMDATYRADRFKPAEPSKIDFLDIKTLVKNSDEWNTQAPIMLAGGSIVRWLLGKNEWTSDFDFWCANDESKKEFRKFLEPYRDEEAFEKFSQTYEFPIGGRTVKVQSVEKNRQDIARLLGSFDISACQFAYFGGDCIYTTELGWADFLQRRLNVVRCDQAEYTKKRVLKYMDMGFKTTKETMSFLLDKTGLEEVEVEY